MYETNEAYDYANVMDYKEEKAKVKEIKRADREFERKLNRYKNQLKFKLLVLIAVDIAITVCLCAVAAAFYAVWYYCFNTDIIYLLGWYAILNWIPNACILSLGGYIRSLVRKYGLLDISREVKTIKREYYSKEI